MKQDINGHRRHLNVAPLLVPAVVCLVLFVLLAMTTSLPKFNWGVALFAFALIWYAVMRSGINRAKQEEEDAGRHQMSGSTPRRMWISRLIASPGGMLALGLGVWRLMAGDATTGWVLLGVGIAMLVVGRMRRKAGQRQ